MWKQGTLLHYGWEFSLVQPLKRTWWRFLKNLKIELPHDPSVPLLGIYPEKIIVWKEKYMPLFIAACSQDKETTYRYIDRGVDKDVIHIHNGMSPIHQKQWNNAIFRNMDGFIDYHAKWSKSEKDKKHMLSFKCRITRKKWYK